MNSYWYSRLVAIQITTAYAVPASISRREGSENHSAYTLSRPPKKLTDGWQGSRALAYPMARHLRGKESDDYEYRVTGPWRWH